MQRSSVVLPLPDAPSSATMVPLFASKEAPRKMWFPPSHFSTLETLRSVMDAGSEPQGEAKPQGGEENAEESEGRDLVHRA